MFVCTCVSYSEWSEARRCFIAIASEVRITATYTPALKRDVLCFHGSGGYVNGPQCNVPLTLCVVINVTGGST